MELRKTITTKDFMKEFGDVRATMRDGMMYLNASDVARSLGYFKGDKPRISKITQYAHPDEQIAVSTKDKLGRTQEMTYVSEVAFERAMIRMTPQRTKASLLVEDADLAKNIDARIARLTLFREYVYGAVLPNIVKEGFHLERDSDVRGILQRFRSLAEQCNEQLNEITQNAQELASETEAFRDEFGRLPRAARDAIEQASESIGQNSLVEDLMIENGMKLSYGNPTDVRTANPHTLRGMVERMFGDVRTQFKDGQVYFALNDITANKLGYARPVDIAARLGNKCQSMIFSTKGGPQTLKAVNESGFFETILTAEPNKSGLSKQDAERVIQELDTFATGAAKALVHIRQFGFVFDGEWALPLDKMQALDQNALDILEHQITQNADILDSQRKALDELADARDSAEKAAYRREYGVYVRDLSDGDADYGSYGGSGRNDMYEPNEFEQAGIDEL